MNILLVTYDLNRPIQEYASLFNLLDNSPISVRIGEFSYAIATNNSASHLWNTLQETIDNDDMLFVISLASSWNGQGGQKHQDFEALLKKYLPKD